MFTKRAFVMIKSMLRRPIRRAQIHNLIGWNSVEPIDLPNGQSGRLSCAITQADGAEREVSGAIPGADADQGLCPGRCHLGGQKARDGVSVGERIVPA